MRIISNFHDYYDGSKAYDKENLPLYLRKEEVVASIDSLYAARKLKTIDKEVWSYLIPNISSGHQYWLQYPEYGLAGINIVFCGKLYHCIEIFRHGNEVYDHNRCYYSIDDISKKIDFEKYKSTFKDIQELFNGTNKNDINNELHIKYNSPILLCWFNKGKYELVKNPNLKKLQFYKVVDAFTCYQEINMYINNLAIPEKPMPVIPDILKVQSHGFDKYSFRKRKKS